MQARKIGAIVAKCIPLAVVFGTAWQAIAQNAKTPYPTMAPVEQYLIEDRSSEVAWHGVRRRSPFRAMQKSWFSDVTVTKPLFRARTGLCASCSAPGLPQSMTRTSGIPSCAHRIASIRLPCAVCYRNT